jgi:6-pyruvoyl-tetrahydropterin synthase
MFLRNVTCIDHAYIDQAGKITGGSFHQEIIVKGSVDELEQVVVDFSAVKKQIKQIIDDKENGFDHKLLIIENFSNCSVSKISDTEYEIKTPFYRLSVPMNAIKFVKYSPSSEQYYNMKSLRSIIEDAMRDELEVGLNNYNQNTDICVDLKLTQEIFGKDPKTFTYFHGLKHSTSWGCNNIAHGHTSFVEVYDDTGTRLADMERLVSWYLDNSMLAFKDNFVAENVIQYTTPRGLFVLEFQKGVNVIVMDQETTIENIVEHVCHLFKQVFQFHAVERIFISEGLQKGALKVISEP